MSATATTILAELRALNRRLDKLRAEMKATAIASTGRDGAVKRAVAAKMMGVSISKLDALVRVGKVRTADDSHLIPMAEVKRYCAPKVKRERKPAIGHRARMKHAEAQSEEAWSDASGRVKAGAR